MRTHTSSSVMYEQIQTLLFTVFAQIATSNPLVSDRQELSVLQREYAEEDTIYQLKIKVKIKCLPFF